MSSAPPPLSQTDAKGKPYERSSKVNAELTQILGTDMSTWTANGLESETLVHLIRVLRKRGDQDRTLGRLVEQLGNHIAQIAKDMAKGFDRTTTDEIILKVGEDVVTLVLADNATRQSEFVEAAFRVAVQRRTLNEVQKRKKHPRRRHLVAVDGETNPLESLPDGGLTPEECLIAAEESELTPVLVRKGLAAISDSRHREAVVLHHLKGWPITDKDAETPTLCKHFGLSARQIQNWMTTAFAEMRAALGEKT